MTTVKHSDGAVTRFHKGVFIHPRTRFDMMRWWALHPTAGLLRADTLKGMVELIDHAEG